VYNRYNLLPVILNLFQDPSCNVTICMFTNLSGDCFVPRNDALLLVIVTREGCRNKSGITLSLIYFTLTVIVVVFNPSAVALTVTSPGVSLPFTIASARP
jgi:hypothetical protein